MKNIKLTLIAAMGLVSFGYAGGDIIPVTTHYEIEDAILATEFATEVEQSTPSIEEPIIPIIENKKLGDKKVEEPKKTQTSSSVGGAYMGLGITAVQYDTNCKCPRNNLSGTDKTAGVIGKLGYDFNEYIGVEARGLKTMIASDGGEVEHLSILLKPSIPLGEDFKAYGLAGWGQTKTSGHLRKTDVDGFSWGAGLGYSVGENISLFADYERLFQESDAPDLDSINMGIDYRF